MKFTIRRVLRLGVSDGERAGGKGISGWGVRHDGIGGNADMGCMTASLTNRDRLVRPEQPLSPVIRIFLKSVAMYKKHNGNFFLCSVEIIPSLSFVEL